MVLGVGAFALGSRSAAAEEPAPADTVTRRDLEAQDVRVRELEARVKALSESLAQVTAQKEPPPEPKKEAPPDPLHGIVITSYVQAQLEGHEDSEDQLRQGGAPYNQNRFLIRRGRLKLQRDWEFSSVMIEIDGNTVKGPALNLHHAEASVLYRGGAEAPAPPLVQLTLGLFDVPFGDELVESPRTRFFTERSLGSRSLFPSEPDLGARLAGQLGWFRYALAATNGEPSGVLTGFPLQDPNSAKDLIAKVGAAAKPSPSFELSGDVSVLNGKGFARGSDATKNSIVWKDGNEDGSFHPSEVSGTPAAAAVPSKNFDRWAVGGDLKIRLRTSLGWSQLYGEVVLANNLDRGMFVADPTVTGDVRELSYLVGVVQEITPYLVLGFRTDLYDPNADSTDKKLGKPVPTTQRVRTYSPTLGAVLPGRARLVFQYDFIRDHLARDVRGVPTDLANDQWTLRLQGEL
jgi:hypothetical protein